MNAAIENLPLKSEALSPERVDMIAARVDSLEGLKERLEVCLSSLNETGSLFLVLNWDEAYEAKPIADLVFGGASHLRNEVIWVVRSRRDVRGFSDRHKTILWYVKDPSLAPFETLTMPRSMETRKRFGNGRIVSSVNPRTGRRAPTRVEGASMTAPLNDVWVWDESQATWLFELEEIDGRVSSSTHAATALEGGTVTQKLSADEALLKRFEDLIGLKPKSLPLEAVDL